jgi:DNA helicase II / ATP-dependent DNA helicase PcrA
MAEPRLAAAPRPHTNTPTAQAPVSLDSVRALLRGLNRDQRRAVTHGDGPQLVIAGPGTGKTEVVTRRVAWLIATKRARPREILALTFSDAAAEEMQARVDVLVPYGQADASIHTFHALGDRLLRENAFELGLPGDVRLVNRAESVLLLREHLFELGLQRYLPLGDPTRFLGALADLFARAKDEGITPETFHEHVSALRRRAASASADDAALLADMAASRAEMAAAFAAYQRLLGERGYVDHGDQVLLALRLLRERPAIQAAVSSRYRYLLVDEFQDTNPVQFELVLALAGAGGNVTVVGDPDQAIYTFRGAATSNARRFVAANPGLRCVFLRRNYRSRAPVLEASRRLIGNGGGARLELPELGAAAIVAQRRAANARPVRELCFATPEDEADGVAACIAQRVAEGQPPSDFAVLVRTNADADAFLRSLRALDVPARGVAAARLLDQPVVRALLAYLRVLADPEDGLELYVLAAAEPYRVGDADLAVLTAHARRRHASLWQVLGEVVDASSPLSLSTGALDAVRRLVGDVRHGLEIAAWRTSGEVLYDHLRRSGRLAELAAADLDGSGAVVLRGVARFFSLVRKRGALLAEDRIAFLVPHLAALDDAGADEREAGPPDEQVVSVLTVHRAKGLEFRCVYVCGLVDGRFPGRGRPAALSLPAELLQLRDGVADDDELAEERRLAYVAMTRARDELWLSRHLSGPNGRGRRRPSPFIAEALDRPNLADLPAVEPLARLAPGTEMERAGPSPLPAHGEQLTLSFSQIDDYISCPARYRLRYVLGVPAPAHHSLAYGSAMHHAVAAFHLRRADGVTMTDEELIATFAAGWRPEGFLSREHEEARFAAGCAALRRFRAQQLDTPARTVAIERPFSFGIGRDVVRGRIDRLDQTDEGTVIVDYKSSDVPDQAKADARARDSLQLQVYALAHHSETGALPREVQLHFLDSSTIGRAKPDEVRLARARERIAAVAAGIRAGDFTPKPNPVACGYCPFRVVCPSSAA